MWRKCIECGDMECKSVDDESGNARQEGNFSCWCPEGCLLIRERDESQL